MKGLHGIAFVLVVIGGLNWGLVALGSWAGSNWNVVNLLFGHKKECRACNPSGM